MSFLLMLPLAIFAALMPLVAGTIVSVEIAERRDDGERAEGFLVHDAGFAGHFG